MLLGLAATGAGAGAAAWPASTPSPRGTVGTPDGCRVILVATGFYRLTINTNGPLPVADFKGAWGPIFEPINWGPNGQEGMGLCDQPMGDVEVDPSPNVTPVIYQVTNEMWSQIRVDHPMPRDGKWSAKTWPYRDFGNMAAAISRDQLWAAFRQLMTDIATNLISRYADPGGLFSDAGAQWVARQAVKLMMQSYVEGRDPGLIIDGMLTDMVDHLEGHAESAAEKLGGPVLKAAVRERLKEIAAAVTAMLVEAQPDGQTVRVSAYNPAGDCSHALTVWWNFKGGGYRGVLSVECGNPPNNWISGVNVNSPTVEPGKRGTITAQALSQLGVPMPLASASSVGIALVQAAGAGEPAARGLPGRTANFEFTAATPRADGDYDVRVDLLTSDMVGRLSGFGRSRITVKNVAPTIPDRAPNAIAADPGDWLELAPASIVVEDRNADAGNAGEVRTRSLRLQHPAGLRTAPLFDTPGNPRQAGPHQATTGRYTFRFDRRGRVADPHRHGTWPLTVEVADDDGATATTTIGLRVRDVAPTVEQVTVAPAYVHQNGSAEIQVRIRVRDRNTAADIREVQVDSRPAASSGGSLATIGGGLTEVGRGADWIEFELAQPFIQAKTAGEYPIPVEVRDSVHVVKGSGTLHVGNEAPRIGGYGYLLDADSVTSVENAGQFVLVSPDGLCPGDHFRAGLIASDPENDSLKVTARFRGIGPSTPLRHTSERVWVGDLVAPDTPGTYTLELTVTEVPPDKDATVTMTIVVKDCGQQQEDDPRVALADPATPADIAAAPADPAGQKEFAAIVGSGVVAPSGELPGTDAPPSGPAVALLDSIGLVLSGSVDPMAPPIETYILATGGSTGPVGQMFAINRSDVPIRLPRSVMVVEPVAITPDIQARVTDLLQRYIAAGGSPVTLDMYCLERLRLPPAGGTLLRIVAAADAAPFRRFSGILDAVDRVRDGIGLHPDSDPTEYFHAIRQWALWSAQEEFDADGFARAFVETTRQTLEAGGEPWTAEVEQAVSGLIPNRWNDVRNVLREAGFSPR